MNSSVGSLLDASFAYAIVVISQALYCCCSKYKGGLNLPGAASTLFWLSFGFFVINTAFMATFIEIRKDGSTATSLVLCLWKAGSEGSISCFEVVVAFGRIKDGWPKPREKPIVFGLCVALHSALLFVGLWQLAERRFGVLWAVPIFIHLQHSITAISGIRTGLDRTVSSCVPVLEAVISICASGTALGVSWAAHQVATQCLACILVVCSNWIRPWVRNWEEKDLREPWYNRRENSSIKIYTTFSSRVLRHLQLASSELSRGIGGLISALTQSWQSRRMLSTSYAPDLESAVIRSIEIDQTTEVIPGDLRRRPSDNETWRRRFIAKAHLPILQPTIESLPTAHIVQQARGRQEVEIAVTESCLEWLSTLSIPLKMESNFPENQMAPTDGEINVYGIATAKKRAEKSFMAVASDAIIKGDYGHGLDRYYMQHTRDRRMLGRIVWMILLNRILVSSKTDRQCFLRFIQNCTFVCLHQPARIDGIRQLLHRDEKEWLRLFSRLCNERVVRPLGDPEEEIYLASLVWGLLESAENRGSSLYCLESWSPEPAEENLRKLVNIIGVGDKSHPQRFGEIDQGKTNQRLSTCTMFEGAGPVNVLEMTKQICKYVPLSPQGITRFPIILSRTIRHSTANALWKEMSNMHSSVPSLEAPEDDITTFLCCCLLLEKPLDSAIGQWAASEEGHRCYRELKEEIRNSYSEERTVLTLLAMISFQQCYSPCPSSFGEGCRLISECHLIDFCQHLDGGALVNRNTLRRMACSLWTHVGASCPRISHLLEATEPSSSKNGLDALSDCYWWYRTKRKYNHRGACESIWGPTHVHVVGRELIIDRKPSNNTFGNPAS